MNKNHISEHVEDKVLYCIRHGESYYNEWRKRSLLNFSWIFVRDPMIIDAALTSKGKQQAEALCQRINEKQFDTKIEIIVCSPLTRAIQTALLAFPAEIPILIAPLCREELGSACDIGRSSEELTKEFAEFSDRIDFSVLTSVWWVADGQDPMEHAESKTVKDVLRMKESNASLGNRVEAFIEQLSNLPQKHVAIVGHSGFFRKMLRMQRKLENCELYVTELSKIRKIA